MLTELASLSEYGCITNTRKFEEVAALYDTEMTSVYSGGLVYEYSQEGNGYGLVTIDGSSISEGSDFSALKTALAGTSNPSGDGGYNSTGGASGCPAKSATWNVTDDALPAIPSGAAALMKSGAGTGAGLTGTGSQNAGGTSTGTATPGSGSATTTAKTSATGTGKSAASNLQSPFDKSPIVVSGMVILFTALGAALL